MPRWHGLLETSVCSPAEAGCHAQTWAWVHPCMPFRQGCSSAAVRCPGVCRRPMLDRAWWWKFKSQLQGWGGRMAARASQPDGLLAHATKARQDPTKRCRLSSWQVGAPGPAWVGRSVLRRPQPARFGASAPAGARAAPAALEASACHPAGGELAQPAGARMPPRQPQAPRAHGRSSPFQRVSGAGSGDSFCGPSYRGKARRVEVLTGMKRNCP